MVRAMRIPLAVWAALLAGSSAATGCVALAPASAAAPAATAPALASAAAPATAASASAEPKPAKAPAPHGGDGTKPSRANAESPPPPSQELDKSSSSSASVGPGVGSVAPKHTDLLTGQGPLRFRSDQMQVLTKPNRAILLGNVVMRRTDLLLCCKRFESVADEKWQWQKLTCHDDVRAQRNDEMIWSDRADFMPESSEVIFSGHPRVRQGESVLEGERILVNIDDDRARVIKPRGRLVSEPRPKPTPPPTRPSGELPVPEKCPLPPAPQL
jgi:lipopolysaccharide export system protein LptA